LIDTRALLVGGLGDKAMAIDFTTTAKGCKIVDLNEMEHRGFSSSLIKGITASYLKIG